MLPADACAVHAPRIEVATPRPDRVEDVKPLAHGDRLTEYAMIQNARELEAVLQRARTAGARAAEILIETAELRSTWNVRRGVAGQRSSTTATAQVRCWTDGGRYGLATGSPEALDALIAAALAACPSAPEDALAGPTERIGGTPRGLDIDDRRLPILTDEERAEVIVGNERAAIKETVHLDPGTFELHERKEHRLFASSRGVVHEAKSTTFQVRGSVRLRTEEGKIELVEETGGRAFASVACLPFGSVLGQRATALLREKALIGGPTRVLLPPRATGHLVAWLGDCFAMSSNRPGSTFLDALDGPLHRKLHLVDDGLLNGGLRTRPFDDRGVPPTALTLIREGHATGRYVDLRTAREREDRPTGHDAGGTLRATNLLLNAGTRSIHALLGELGGTVFQVDALPDTSGFNAQTGRVDTVVHGTVLKGGKPIGAQRFLRMRGDLSVVLGQVVAVASDTDRILHVDAPGLFLDGFEFG